MPKRPGRKSEAQTPAPKSDRIYGSSKNAVKSASSESSASSISLSSKIIKALENKLEKFKETHDTKKVSLRDLKAVYRRGLGAYSNTHRPTITGGVPNSRNAWAMARVNKFLLKAGGTKVKAAYVQDDDLLKYESGGKTFSFEKLKKDLQEFAEIEFYEGEKYSDISVSCDLAKGNCYDISEELYDFLKTKGYKELSLVEVRDPLFDLSDAHYEWKVTEYSHLYHIMLKVNDYYIDFTGIQYSKEDIGLKIYTEEQLKKRWGKMVFFDRSESEYEDGGLMEYGEGGQILSKEEKKLFKYLVENWQEPFYRNQMDAQDIRKYEKLVKKGIIIKGGYDNKVKQYYSDNAIDNIELAYKLVNELGLDETIGGGKIIKAYNYRKTDVRYKKGGETESEKDLQEIYKIQKMQELQKTMEDGGVMAKGGKTKAKGDCYVAAGDIVMDYLLNQRGFGAYRSEFEFHGTPYLVHAEVAGQGHLEGIRYGHAWIEDDNLVYDYSNGRKIVFPKQLYYSIGDVDEDNPMKYQKYTFEEANSRMMKTGNYGCWDIDVEFAEGGSVIGDRKISDVRIVNTDLDAKVYATYEDGYEEVVFDYYPDEIEFSSTEIIGLTVDQANELKDEKQQKYNMYSNSAAEFKHGGVADSDEVVCVNCDWEWNKANSDKEHMYNCHKCGFDNTLFYTVFNDTLTLEQISEKHGVDMEYLQAQFEEGTKHEMDEHTKGGTNLAREVGETIALHHLEEMPDYYEKIKMIDAETYEDGGDISSKEQYLEALLTEAFDLLDAHINNGGPLDYSDKKYGYLNDEVEDVQVGYFKDDDLDSSYAEELREEGFEMDLQDAIDTLEHRLSSISEEIDSTRWEDFKKNNKYEKGGNTEKDDCGCGSSASKVGSYVFAKGGLAYGNSHDKGGMPMKVGSTGQNIEIEGGEGVINKRSMQMTKKVNFEGKMMTPCEVISKINEMGGGVKFDCSDVKEIIEKDGDF